MCYYVFYGRGGTIDKVVVDVTVTNVSIASFGTPTYVYQSYELEFIQTNRHERNAEPSVDGNKILRGRSGNPGYLNGLPLLNGELIEKDGQAAINARIPGLQVFGSTSSPFCDPTVDIFENSQPVYFGQDMLSGCTLELTYENFSSFCSQNNEHMRDSEILGIGSKVPKYIWANSSFSYVGIFGNSDPLDKTQWIQMEIIDDSDTPIFDANDRVCSNMPTSLNYEFLYAYVGALKNPQAKIMAARAHYGFEDIVFSSELQSQQVMIATTITFTQLGRQEVQKYTPSVPPVLWTVPYDVFYPFSVSGDIPSRGVLSFDLSFVAVPFAAVVLSWNSRFLR